VKGSKRPFERGAEERGGGRVSGRLNSGIFQVERSGEELQKQKEVRLAGQRKERKEID